LNSAAIYVVLTVQFSRREWNNVESAFVESVLVQEAWRKQNEFLPYLYVYYFILSATMIKFLLLDFLG